MAKRAAEPKKARGRERDTGRRRLPSGAEIRERVGEEIAILRAWIGRVGHSIAEAEQADADASETLGTFVGSLRRVLDAHHASGGRMLLMGLWRTAGLDSSRARWLEAMQARERRWMDTLAQAQRTGDGEALAIALRSVALVLEHDTQVVEDLLEHLEVPGESPEERFAARAEALESAE